jgi:sugar phosphate isomerase/epimerase
MSNMAQIGLLAPEFPHASLDENLDAIAATGATGVQFDLRCAVGTTFADTLEPPEITRIKQGFAQRGLAISALSGTCNMIDPDPVSRRRGIESLKRLIGFAPLLGTAVVTLCTGSRDPKNMWRRHPDNDTAEAWADLLASLHNVIPVAEAHGITLGVEPEIANVVDSARKARKLMDEIGSSRLKIIMDGANIFHAGELASMRQMLDEAFELVGNDLILAHAKDLDHDGEAGHLPAGQGLLDYPHYLKLLQESGYDGALILHGLRAPAEAPDAIAFVRANAPAGFIDPGR